MGLFDLFCPRKQSFNITASVALQQSGYSNSHPCVSLFWFFSAAAFTFKKRTERVDWRKLGKGGHFILRQMN